MVGTDPHYDAATTTVATVVVPLRLTFPNGKVLDGTKAAAVVPGSPIFVDEHYPEGTTQYGDAFVRSEFWQYTQASAGYHVLLRAPKLAPTVAATVPSGDGYTKPSVKGAGVHGYVAFDWFVQTLEPQIIQRLRVPPAALTLFVTSRTDVLESGGGCCYRGYHAVLPRLNETWTTVWASVRNDDVSVLSHEVAEWLDDPFYTNRVPPWIEPENGACGGPLLEVGDPVTNHTFLVNGYRLQDAAFFSWFSRQTPSIGIYGRYDLVGKLSGPAAVCV